MRAQIKMISAPIDIIEKGEELARRYTDGNFSAMVRMLIEERVAFDGEAWAARMNQVATEIHEGLAKAEEGMA